MINLYVLAFLHSGNEVLLLRRKNAKFGDGLYSLVGGKVESGEASLQAVHREVLEEVSLDIPEEKFQFMHMIHRKGSEAEIIAICFKADIHGMEPKNIELAKHDDMQLFNVDELPLNIIPAHKQIILLGSQNVLYSEHGW